MANDIDKTSSHYKGEFSSIYEVNQKYPSGGVAGDYVVIDSWAHYWNADRGTWCVNEKRDEYWDELITCIIGRFNGYEYMGVATTSTVPPSKIAKIFYFALTGGKYANFGNIDVPAGISVLITEDGKTWKAENLITVAQELGVSTTALVSQKALSDAINAKADVKSVNAALDLKANKTDVDAANAEQNALINKKANQTDVDNSFKSTTAYIDSTNAKQDAVIVTKANQLDVENALKALRDEMGERVVIEGDVSNHPDEEDLTSKTNPSGTEVLSLKDRKYNPLEFSGKGYKILRKNLTDVTYAVSTIEVTKAPTSDGYVSIIINSVESHVDLVASTDTTVDAVAKKIADKLTETMEEYVVSVDAATVTCTRKIGGSVTASSFSDVNTGAEATMAESTNKQVKNIITANMINQPNTIYEIRYDYDLNGTTLKIPEGCTLKFEGGSIGNGTIKGNNTAISGNARLYVDSSGTFVGRTHVTWFLQKRTAGKDYNAREDVMRALLLSTLTDSRVLDFDNESLYIKGSLNLSENRKGVLTNARITYEPENALESLFECDSNRIWNGSLSITDSTFSCKNPSNLQGVNVIHLHRWYNTAGWYFQRIYFDNFTGYFLVNESYLQEGSFDDVMGNGVGFISYNNFGVFGETKGTSNVITFKDCSTNNGNGKIDTSIVPYKSDFYDYGNMKFINCVFQGKSPKEMRALYLSGDTGFSVANHIVMDTYWNESEGTEALDIDFGTAIEFKGQSNFDSININANRVCLDFKNCQVSAVTGLVNSINIKDGVTEVAVNIDGYLMHYPNADKLTEMLDNGIMTRFKNNGNSWRESGNSNQIIALDKTVNGLEGLLQTSYWYNLRQNFRFVDVNSVPCIEIYYTGSGWQDVQIPTNTVIRGGFTQSSSSYFVYRIAPQVDVTEDNKADVLINLSNTTNYGAHRNITFDVGTKANEFSAWKKTILTGYADGTQKYIAITPKNALIQIAALNTAMNMGILNDDIAISNDGQTISRRNKRCTILNIPSSAIGSREKRILKSEQCLYKLTDGSIYAYNATTDKYTNLVNENNVGKGDSASRPTDISAGFQYFDTTLGKPIWWSGSKWVDAAGANV